MDDGSILIIIAALAVTALIYAAVVVQRRARERNPTRPAPARKAAPPAEPLHGSEAVRVLRAIGFFKRETVDREAVDADEVLAQRLEQRIEAEWGAPLAQLARTRSQLDVLYALQDPLRAYRAPDKYFYPGDDAFLEIVGKCGELEDIAPYTPLAEQWTGPDGPVEVQFRVDARQSAYSVRDPKYIDPGLFGALNEAGAGHARRLRVTDALGMPNVVLALNDEEADTLVRKRGWSFHPAAP